jgi:hypothetical protein
MERVRVERDCVHLGIRNGDALGITLEIAFGVHLEAGSCRRGRNQVNDRLVPGERAAGW